MPASPLSLLTEGAATFWNAGAWMRAQLYAKGVLQRKRLRAKVISIGNISWGGTGKTPFTIWLGGRLQGMGLRAAILTRGYGRTSRDPVQVLPPGTTAGEACNAGNEVQVYLRHLKIPIGVSPSRYEAGRLVEEKFPVDVHLLDDGFQHLELRRDLDLVLIDTQNPWGAYGGFDRLLREGPSALRRSQGILLTRCELGDRTASGVPCSDELREIITKLSPSARIFTVRTKLLGFSDAASKQRLSAADLQARRAAAFCALGNPRNFFRTLERAEIPVVAQKTFPDHHRYRAEDLRRLEDLARQERADCLLTTEKDVVSLPSETSLALPVYWAAIEPVLDGESLFLRWLWERLELPLDRLLASSSVGLDAKELKIAANR